MSTFNFSNIVNPEMERIQHVFAELHLCLEEWGRDWTWLMQDLSQCSLEGKIYNLGLALTAEESDMGCRSDELHQRYQAQIRTFKLEVQRQAEEAAEEEAWREAEKDKGKEKESAPGEEDDAMDGEDADGEAEEAEPPKCPVRTAAHTTKAGSEGQKKNVGRMSASSTYKVACARCAKAGVRCYGWEGMSCTPCKSSCKACEYATHWHGVVAARAAAHAAATKVAVRVPSATESAPTAGPSGGRDLIRCPRTSPLPSSEESGSEEEEEESVPGASVERGSHKPTEDEGTIEYNALMDAEADSEDMFLESRMHTLHAQMHTMH
ncbi:hypothetical protein BDR03DRAFT_1011506, partial [Suillus americanus]